MGSYYTEDDGITNYWDSRYSEWAKTPDYGVFEFKDIWAETRFRHILGEPKMRGSMVLDYGCGNTMFAPFLMRRFASYYGVDTSPTALDIADKFVGGKMPASDKARYHPSLIRRGEKLPFADAMFDCVFTITVLQHQPIPERVRIIGELKRVLKPDGIYVGLEYIGNTLAADMPPMLEEEWVQEWLPLIIVKDYPPEHPEWHADNVWVTKGRE